MYYSSVVHAARRYDKYVSKNLALAIVEAVFVMMKGVHRYVWFCSEVRGIPSLVLLPSELSEISEEGSSKRCAVHVS